MTWEYLISYEHLQYVGISLAILLFFLLLRRIFTKYIFYLLLKTLRKVNSVFLPNILKAFERPLHWFFIILGIYIALIYYPHIDPTQALFMKWFKSILVILVSWGFFNLFSGSSQLFDLINANTKIELDDILIPFLSRVLQFIIVAICISIVLQEFDYHIGGLITGLGLGGLAVSLAAQDAIANLFGGVVLVTEKPFTIDDWISTPSVEGIVEDISFRSTKVRTFDQALVTVPNATLANEPITNWSEMGKRQITFNIRLTYTNSRETFEKAVANIKNLLNNHEGIHQETIFVHINEFADHGMDLFLYFFTKTTNWEQYLDIREEINLEILDILNELDVQIAIPSRKLYVKNIDEHPDLPF